MTTQKLSGLELARKWMDSLGMRHYGEVDAAIAEAGAPEHSGNQPIRAALDSPKHCPPSWVQTGFSAFTSSALEHQRDVGNDFNQAFHSTDSVGTKLSVTAEEKRAWKEALQVAKNLVHSALPQSAGIAAGEGINTNTDAFGQNSCLTTLKVHVNSMTGDAPTHSHSIDVTCNANRSLAIHLWM